ncbi:MAG: hypothetical protein M0Z40_08145, partial [Actinomycetota bacterium]|nr:hypothetical protein [Actinomycetota bacterium]
PGTRRSFAEIGPGVNPACFSADSTAEIVAGAGPNSDASWPGGRKCLNEGLPGVETAEAKLANACGSRGCSAMSISSPIAAGARPRFAAPPGIGASALPGTGEVDAEGEAEEPAG